MKTNTGLKRQLHLISFALKHKGEWHTFSDDKQTVELICATHNLGIIKVNEFQQFTLKSEFNANLFINARS